jgi:hypothetical protein
MTGSDALQLRCKIAKAANEFNVPDKAVNGRHHGGNDRPQKSVISKTINYKFDRF